MSTLLLLYEVSDEGPALPREYRKDPLSFLQHREKGQTLPHHSARIVQAHGGTIRVQEVKKRHGSQVPHNHFPKTQRHQAGTMMKEGIFS